MKFHMRRNYSIQEQYMMVSVEIDNATIEIGMLNESEREALATTLREAADELWVIDAEREDE